MKHLMKVMVLSALLPYSAVCGAQQAPSPPPMDSGMGMGMEHMGAMDPGKTAEHFKRMQEHMLMMHDLSNKILAETDPKKQQALKDQQLELMIAHHKQMMSKHAGKQMNHKNMP